MRNLKISGILLLGLLCWLAACGEATVKPAASPNPVATITPLATPTVPATPTQGTLGESTSTVAVKVTPTTSPTQPPGPAPTKNSGSADPIINVSSGVTFTLKFGQIAKVTSENIELKLVKLVEDSRCPVNVACVWSGQLVLMVEVSRAGQSLGEFEVNSIDAYQTKNKPLFENYSLVLLDATPDQFYMGSPGKGQQKPVTPKDYAIDFLLTKLK